MSLENVCILTSAVCVLLRQWFSNSWSASLCYAARGHICQMSIYCKNHTIMWETWYITCYCLSSAAREPAHNNAVTFCNKMFGDPRLRRMFGLNRVKKLKIFFVEQTDLICNWQYHLPQF